MTVYRVKDWNQHFENSETRKLKSLKWLPLPNKQDGEGYRALWNLPRAPEVFAAWILILEVASKCPERGTLKKDGKALDAKALALKTGCPERVYLLALPALVSIGWLEIEREETPAPGNLPEAPETSGRKGREGKGIISNSPPSPPKRSAPVPETPKPPPAQPRAVPVTPLQEGTNGHDSGQRLDPAKVIPCWPVFKPELDRSGVGPGTLAKAILERGEGAGDGPVIMALAWLRVCARDVQAAADGKREPIKSPNAWFLWLARQGKAPPQADYDEAKASVRLYGDEDARRVRPSTIGLLTELVKAWTAAEKRQCKKCRCYYWTDESHICAVMPQEPAHA